MNEQSARGATHTCPMHPEVIQIGPGSCPKCGMALEPMMPTTDAQENPELGYMTRRFWIAAALTLPLVIVAMGDMLPGKPISRLLTGGMRVWVELALATPVCLWAAWPFYRRAAQSIRSRSLNMFTLIGLGVSVSYLFSLIATLMPSIFPTSFRDETGGGVVYFEAAGVIVTLILLGQMLELKARSKTGAAIAMLLGLAAKRARRVEADGTEEEIPLEAVVAGDLLKVKPGEKVPVDGVVISGRTQIDESMVTGEPLAVQKEEGESVIGSTINGTGSFVMRAERVGGDTLLARIVAMVAEAQRSRAPIQKLADRVAGYFVPAVILIAALTFAVWSLFGPEPRMAYAIVNAVAVLIIACPCALGLATPLSIMVATGRGATQGILFRNAEAIEVLRKVDTLVVDKTGTLTEGKPKLAEVVAVAGMADSDLLRLAANLERDSEHPLAQAIVDGFEAKGGTFGEVTGFESITGKGIRGEIEGKSIGVGNLAMMASLDVEMSALAARADALRAQGQTVVFVACDGEPAGLISVADPIKSSTPAAVRAIRDEGIRIIMLTGDNGTTALAVAEQLGIERSDVIADVLPDEKAAVVKRLQAEGAIVAMAGDGINDAPALAQAQVGIAMGTGTDVAMESASVTLVKGDLRGIVRARRLSRSTMGNIKQNLFFAFAYNSAGVPIAAGLLYPVFGLLLSPVIAAAAMSLSSVSVIANALRLRRAHLG